jgi:hypothetical protein
MWNSLFRSVDLTCQRHITMLTNSWVILFLISKGQLEKDTVFEDCLTDDVYWINLVVIDGKILVEDIVKLGTTAEGVEGDHDDTSQPQQKQQQSAI